jgi:hypothetical protein
MSKLTRVQTFGAMLAAMHLAGMTAVAHAQVNDPASGQGARQAPTERQVGESWRHRKVASQEQAAADATLGRVLARERFSIPTRRPPTCPRQSLPNRADSSAGSLSRLACWQRRWR